MASSDILTVICWAKQVASAIQHLHSRDDPVIYADLKAENGSCFFNFYYGSTFFNY